jgi:mevalonate kinase
MGIGYGKILLFGEHAAVYGHPAIGMSLPLSTEVEVSRGSTAQRVILDGEVQAQAKNLIQAISHELKLTETENYTYSAISSSIPMGSGLGSSSALAVATAKALANCESLELPSHRIWQAANEGEKIFHGTPSGIDTGLALLNGMYLFEAGGNGLPKAAKLQDQKSSCILVGSSPREGTTAGRVESIRSGFSSGNVKIKNAISKLGELSQQGAAIFRKSSNNEVKALGMLADTAHDILAGLGLSTPATNEFLKAGKDFGSLGGKISGAGGGGACYLIFADTESGQRASRELANWGNTNDRRISIHGVFPLLSGL